MAVQENKCPCCGADLTGSECKNCLVHVGEPEKTADEMFRELGYTDKQVHGENISYHNEFFQQILISNKFCNKTSGYYQEIFTVNEILACAKAIKEMEAGGNG